jgi:hypothetical protein
MPEHSQFGDLPQLETLCPECQGTGGWETQYNDAHWEDCPGCLGAGYIATPLGERVLRLVAHHFRQLRDTDT